MVAALFVFGLAFFAAGIWAVVTGSDIILLETGWSRVIAGSVAAVGGIGIVGLGALLAELKAIRHRVGAAQAPGTADSAPADGPAGATAAVATAGLAAAALEREAGAGEPAGDAGAPAPPADGPADAEAAGGSEDGSALASQGAQEPPAPQAPESPDAPAPALRTDIDDEISRALRPIMPGLAAEVGAGTQTAEIPAAEAPPQEEPAPLETAPEAGSPRPARSFSVGGATYVVFTDGTIEATIGDTTRKFASLAEVRAFLASGDLPA
jgi:hypothetical protein